MIWRCRSHRDGCTAHGQHWGPHAVNDTQPVSAVASDTPAPDAAPATAATVVPVGKLLQPETAARPAEASPAPSIAKRLQNLQQLLDQKLIDETEYRQQKQRILNDL